MATSSAFWTLNPIVVRESRARWRGSRAFLLAFFYAAILSAGMWWKYHEISTRGQESSSPGGEFGLAAQYGHELFLTISLLQAGIWLLIAPALTSTAITVERETGLLPAMLLTKMTPGQIVFGKLVSALSFLLLLIIVALPITAICFLLGGVSQNEFIGSVAIQIATALFGASLGLAVSANQKRAASSLGATFGYVALWFITSGLSFLASANWGGVFNLYGWTNPLCSMWFLIQPEEWLPKYPGYYVLYTLADWRQGWHYTVLALGVLSAWQLRRSAQILRKSPELQDEYDEAPHVAAPVFVNPYAPPTPQPYRGNERWRVPGASQVLFGDAAMRRELASCWKTRTPTRRALWILSVPVFFTACCLLWSLFLLWQSPENFKPADIFLTMTLLFSVVWIMGCALMGAGTIARERETGTWNGLRLTLLSERSILTAKVVAPVVACLVYSLPILPLLIVFCWPEHLGVSNVALSDAGFTQWLMSWILMICVALECCCLGAWWSQRAQTSAQASGATLGTLAVAWLVLPILSGTLLKMSNAWLWHPIYGLFEILTRPASGGLFSVGNDVAPLWPRFFGMTVWHLGVAALFFLPTLQRFRRANRLERF